MRGVSQTHFNWDYVSIKTPFPIRRQRWILENNWYEQHVIRLPGQIKYACLPIKRCPGLYTCSFSSPRINMRLPRVLHVETLHRVHRTNTHTHIYTGVRTWYVWEPQETTSELRYLWVGPGEILMTRKIGNPFGNPFTRFPVVFARWFYTGATQLANHVSIHKLKRTENNYICVPPFARITRERISSSGRQLLFNVCPIYLFRNSFYIEILISPIVTFRRQFFY